MCVTKEPGLYFCLSEGSSQFCLIWAPERSMGMTVLEPDKSTKDLKILSLVSPCLEGIQP